MKMNQDLDTLVGLLMVQVVPARDHEPVDLRVPVAELLSVVKLVGGRFL